MQHTHQSLYSAALYELVRPVVSLAGTTLGGTCRDDYNQRGASSQHVHQEIKFQLKSVQRGEELIPASILVLIIL